MSLRWEEYTNKLVLIIPLATTHTSQEKKVPVTCGLVQIWFHMGKWEGQHKSVCMHHLLGGCETFIFAILHLQALFCSRTQRNRWMKKLVTVTVTILSYSLDCMIVVVVFLCMACCWIALCWIWLIFSLSNMSQVFMWHFLEIQETY